MDKTESGQLGFVQKPIYTVDKKTSNHLSPLYSSGLA